MRRDDWIISLKATSTNLSKGHDTILYNALKKLGGKRLTLDPVVDECKRLGYSTETCAGLRGSVKWHLNKLRNLNVVKLELE